VVNDFIDIRGGSGASYRFRLAPVGTALPAMSGNFLYVRSDPAGVKIVCAGTADALTQARDRWSEAVREHQAEAVFVRLNLSRRVRLEEHADIVALHDPPLIQAEQGDVLPAEPPAAPDA
jgi:hypothetical protein